MSLAAAHPAARCGDAAAGRFRVGPNAVTRLAEALRDRLGEGAAEAVFERAGARALLAEPPAGMVDQGAVAALHRALFAALAADDAAAVAAEAGVRTARYLLAHRIPGPAQALLRALPAPPAARLLLRAIRRNAWTFAGSGRCRIRAGRPHRIVIEANPLAVPGCPWHRAVFGELFRTLVSPHVTVSHRRCCADGAPECRFELAVGT